MERPKEGKKQNTNAFQGWYNFSPHLNLFANKGYKMGDMYYNKTKVRLPVKYFPVINCNLLNWKTKWAQTGNVKYYRLKN